MRPIVRTAGLLALLLGALAALPGAAQLTAPPTVEGLRLAVTPAPGDVSLSVAATARDDFEVVAVRVSAVGVRAGELLGAEGGVVSRVADRITAEVEALAAGGRAFVDARDVSALPAGAGDAFVAELPVTGALPSDGILVVTAVAVDDEGNESVPALRVLPVDGAGPADLQIGVNVVPTPGSAALAVSVGSEDPELRELRLRAFLLSARDLRAVGGRISQVPNRLAAPEQRVAVEGDPPFAVEATFRLIEGAPLPADGILLVRATGVDLVGNEDSESAVFFVEERLEVEVVGLEVAPNPITLAIFGEGPRLQVTGVLADGSRVDLSGAASGTTYCTLDETGECRADDDPDTVIQILPDGDVIAFFEGTTTARVANGGFAVDVPAVVNYFASAQALRLEPEPLVLSGVGESAPLRLFADLVELEEEPLPGDPPDEDDDPVGLELTAGVTGTRYASSDSSVLTVDADGVVTAIGVGVATVTATNPLAPGLRAFLSVEVLDGPPRISIAADQGAVAEGLTFAVSADAVDDIGPDGLDFVRFLVNGSPASRDDTPPYEAQLQAPEGGAGLVLRVQGVAVDRLGQETLSNEVFVTVLAPPSTRAPAADMVSPAVRRLLDPNQEFIDFEPAPLRVTEGGSVLLAVDAEAGTTEVEFVVDGSPVGRDRTPRIVQVRNLEDGSTEVKFERVYEHRITAPPVPPAGRSFAVTARAFDGSGNVGTAPAVIVRVVDDQEPQLTVLEPRDGAGVPAGETLPIRVEVFDDLLTLGATVRVFASADPLIEPGDELVERFVLPVVPSGAAGGARVEAAFDVPETVGADYFVQAWAVDSAGQQSRSELIRVVAQGEQPPSVRITEPVNGIEVLEGDEIPVSAVARDERGVVRVDFFVDGEFLLSDYAAPWSFPFVVPVGRAGSSLSFSALAVDDAGNETPAPERPVSVVGVVADTTAPSVSLADPDPAVPQVETQPLLISVAGRDDARVARVEVDVDGAVRFEVDSPGIVSALTNSFYTSFVLPADELGAGRTLTLVARAIDAAGNVAESDPLLVDVVADAPPEIQAFGSSGGSANAVLVRREFDLFVDARDDVGVSEVRLSAPGGQVVVDDRAPYRFTRTAPGAPTSLEYQAVAVDVAGQESAPVTLTLAVEGDVDPPRISILEPRDGDLVFQGQSRAFVASGQDNVEIRSVGFQLLVDGAVAAEELVTTFELDTNVFQRFTAPEFVFGSGLVGRDVRLRARALDAAGLEGLDEVQLTVAADAAPTVSITAPFEGDRLVEGERVLLRATATDDVGVVRAVPLSGGRLLDDLAIESPGGIDLTQPLELEVPVPISPSEPPTLGLRVIDTRGQSGQDEIALVVVDDPNPPTSEISSPQTGLRVLENDSFHIVVETTDDLRTEQVVFLVNDEEVAAVSEPFEGPTLTEVKIPNPETFGELVIERVSSARFRLFYTVPREVEGGDGDPLRIVARAIDPAGNATDSTPVLVDVLPDEEPPTVVIETPDEGDRIGGGDDFRVLVRAYDNVDDEEDLRTRIEIDVTGEAVVEVSGEGDTREVVTVLPLDESPVWIEARATDLVGNVGEADSIVVTVLPDQEPRIESFSPGGGSRRPEGLPVSFRAVAADDFGIGSLMLVRLQGDLGAIPDAGATLLLPSQPDGPEFLYDVEGLAPTGLLRELLLTTGERTVRIARDPGLSTANLLVRLPPGGLELVPDETLRIEAVLSDPSASVDYRDASGPVNLDRVSAELVLPRGPPEAVTVTVRDAGGAAEPSWLEALHLRPSPEPEGGVGLELDLGVARLSLDAELLDPPDTSALVESETLPLVLDSEPL
ncbi:MAG: Ig-like domain-containing protein, partial [Myxococcota bacterium]|nr:Ig-like domain-containing protein [Myxococcota bacterium]